MIKVSSIHFCCKICLILIFLILFILTCRDSRIIVKLGTVNKIMSIDFTWKAEMTIPIFYDNIIDRDLIKFLNKNKNYDRSWKILIDIIFELYHFDIEIIIIQDEHLSLLCQLNCKISVKVVTTKYKLIKSKSHTLNSFYILFSYEISCISYINSSIQNDSTIKMVLQAVLFFH